MAGFELLSQELHSVTVHIGRGLRLQQAIGPISHPSERLFNNAMCELCESIYHNFSFKLHFCLQFNSGSQSVLVGMKLTSHGEAPASMNGITCPITIELQLMKFTLYVKRQL